ncbi:MAG: hypothetical protein ACJ79R_15610 [Anaeromyxobacteraceae bacterium]
MTRVSGWKEEAIAAVGVLAVIAVGALLFMLAMMPFVFPVMLVVAGGIARHLTRRSAAGTAATERVEAEACAGRPSAVAA